MKPTAKPGTPAQYAEAIRRQLDAGIDLELLNRANHIALESGQISRAHFLAAARVLAEAVLRS